MEVGKLLQDQEMEGRVIAAICAAPTALKAHNIAKGKSLTSYPSMKDRLMSDYKYSDDIVVTDGELKLFFFFFLYKLFGINYKTDFKNCIILQVI